MDYTYGGKYRVEEEIGFGGCGAFSSNDFANDLVLTSKFSFLPGSVFMGTHTVAGKEVAVKVEPANMKFSMLKQESRIYKSLMGGPGVPWIMWSGRQGDYNVMVMDLLGPSLEDLFQICNKQFSLKTVLLLADQMVRGRRAPVASQCIGLVNVTRDAMLMILRLCSFLSSSSSIRATGCTATSSRQTSSWAATCKHRVDRRPPTASTSSTSAFRKSTSIRQQTNTLSTRSMKASVLVPLSSQALIHIRDKVCRSSAAALLHSS